MEFKTNQEKVAYYSRYFPVITEYARNSDFTSSDGESFDDSVDFYEAYDSSLKFKSKLLDEMIQISRSDDIKEENFSKEFEALLKRVRSKLPQEILEEFSHE